MKPVSLINSTPDLAIVLMDIMMPEMDGYRTMQAIRENPRFRRAADRRAHGKGDEGRPREMPGGGCFRTISPSPSIPSSCRRALRMWLHQIGGERGHERPARPSWSDRQKVNILLVDDQPRQAPQLRESSSASSARTLLKAPSAQAAFEHLLEIRHRGGSCRCLHARPRRRSSWRAMIREHPRFQKTAIHLRLGQCS